MTDSSQQTEIASSPWVGGWWSPVIAALFTVGWGLTIYSLIGDRPAVWKYGVIPNVPAQSVFTTSEVPKGRAPKQVILPERPQEARRENR